MYTVNRLPLSDDWNQRAPEGYDVVIVGSGYGGAITAARVASAQWPNGKPSICVLERGKGWLPSQFPDTLTHGAAALRHSLNPLGLYDFRFGTDIGILMGSGLGGTSLVNANVAFQPDPEVFDDSPRGLNRENELLVAHATVLGSTFVENRFHPIPHTHYRPSVGRLPDGRRSHDGSGQSPGSGVRRYRRYSRWAVHR